MHHIAWKRSRPVWLLGAAIAACAITGCTATKPATREYQDEHTAATVTVAGRGLLFAEAQSAPSVNARNYLTLVPVEINRGGTHVLYWYGYTWSTVDRRFGHEPPEQYALVVDGRQITLTFRDATPQELGLSAAPVKPGSPDARTIVAITNRADLRLVADSKELGAVGNRGGTLEPYDLWEDGRAAINDFLNGSSSGH
jgi:hypothetical protein